MSAERAEKTETTKKQPDSSAQVLNFPNGRPQQQNENTIDLLDLFREYISKWWILLIAIVVGAAVMGAYTFLFVTPKYQSSSMIYVYSKSTSITSLTDLQIGTQLTSDFTIIAKTREVIEQVNDDLGLNMTYEKLVKEITMSNPDDSRVLEITVTDTNPDRACDIANDMASVLSKRIAEVTNTDEPTIVQKAISDNKKVSPSYTKNCLLGALVLLVVVLIIITAFYLLDDTIKTEDDVKKYLGLNVLACVPINHNAVSSEEAGKNQKKSEGHSSSQGESRSSKK